MTTEQKILLINVLNNVSILSQRARSRIRTEGADEVKLFDDVKNLKEVVDHLYTALDQRGGASYVLDKAEALRKAARAVL